jgi:ribosomal protein S18 acetylase RimI-like enzyme
VQAPELVAASRFPLAELARVFTASFEGYVVPLHVDAAALRRTIELYDVDLDASRVALLAGEAVGFVDVGVRGRSAWIGGMGVVPAHRRAGIGLALMRAAQDEAAARGIGELWLEVITTNTAALRLYEQLGYARVRELEVWDVEGGPPGSSARETTARAAHERVRALRRTREPWQRADPTVKRLIESATTIGLVGAAAAAVVRPDGAPPTVEQIAAEDVDAAADVLAAALARCGSLRLANIPAGSEVALALTRFGDAPRLRQLELRLGLPAPATGGPGAS